MIRRTHLLIATVALAVSIALVGTSGVSSVATDRGVEVAVVDDSDAYLGVERDSRANKTTGNLTVRNQFPTGTTVDVTVDNGTETTAFELEPGASESVRYPCNETVTIDASGSDVDVSLERSIDCS